MGNIKDVFDTRETLDAYVHERRSGNTTRQVDAAIQALFKGKVVKIVDHSDDGDNMRASKILFKAILRRLEYEYHLGEMFKLGQIRVDSIRYIIELTDKYFEARDYAIQQDIEHRKFWYNGYNVD